MAATREEFRLGILGDGIEEWHALADPLARSAELLPELSAAEREAFVADTLLEYLSGSLIAISEAPAPGRKPRPLPPAVARAAVESAGWRGDAPERTLGYVTTRPGQALYGQSGVCWPCEGYASRLATSEVQLPTPTGPVRVPVCPDHESMDSWPEGAAAAISQTRGGRLR